MDGSGQRAEADAERVAARLRALRRERRLSIGALAALSGVPASTISKIENRQLNPSLVHAINLATALGANLGFLMDRDGARPEPTVVVRAGSRAEIAYPEMGLTLQDLSGRFAPGVLEARILRIAPGAGSGPEPMSHPGEELCHVLDGALRYTVAGQIYELGAGDTLHFKCDQRHAWSNGHAGETTALLVFSDGLSF